MAYRKPTYEEYIKATNFAKFRYRFGIFVQIIALFLLIFLLIYTIQNIEEMKANPVKYAEEKLGVKCMASNIIPFQTFQIYNGSNRNIEAIKQEE